jgi:hypothetical protein
VGIGSTWIKGKSSIGGIGAGKLNNMGNTIAAYNAITSPTITEIQAA